MSDGSESHESKNPFSDNPCDSPKHAGGPPPAPAGSGEGDATGGVIPYKNVPALLAYYFGIFSFIPCIGLFLAIPALVLGIIGLRRRKQNPAVKGSVHAWIGIVMGAIFTLIWGLLLIGMIIHLLGGAADW